MSILAFVQGADDIKNVYFTYTKLYQELICHTFTPVFLLKSERKRSSENAYLSINKWNCNPIEIEQRPAMTSKAIYFLHKTYWYYPNRNSKGHVTLFLYTHAQIWWSNIHYCYTELAVASTTVSWTSSVLTLRLSAEGRPGWVSLGWLVKYQNNNTRDSRKRSTILVLTGLDV